MDLTSLAWAAYCGSIIVSREEINKKLPLFIQSTPCFSWLQIWQLDAT